MEKLKNEYLSEISNLYEELRKDTYGERKGGGHELPPNSNSFYVYACRLYKTVWDILEHYPEFKLGCSKELIFDSERLVLYELNILRSEKNKDNNSLRETLEKYYLKIGGDLHAFLPEYNK